MTKSEKIRDKLEDYQQFIQKENAIKFCIADIKGTSQILISDKEEKCFKVLNPELKEIFFIPVDGKEGMLKYGESFCDAITFDNYFFCFIELKHNATSINDRAVRKNREKAIKQIENTSSYFNDLFSENYYGLHREAYVSTPKIYPRQNTAWQDLRLELLEKNMFELYEANQKEF